MSVADGDSLLQFPCSFPIKAMGRSRADFSGLVLDIIRRHVAEHDIDDVSHRDSRAGSYVSVTVTITAHSRAQLDAIYRELSGHEHVVMAL
ncbi:MAG: DUF493 domain-containing protein [Gammaproteobacteria bacterium]|nr:DUF493 domain-containing protein [Gammaproteobacteria bacterium]